MSEIPKESWLKRTGNGFKNFFIRIKHWFSKFGKMFKFGDAWTKGSFVIMGLSHLKRGQIVKGILYFLIELLFIFYLIVLGGKSLLGLITLGTKVQGWVYDEELGRDVLIKGDNSMLLLLYGIVTVIVIITFIFVYIKQVKSAYEIEEQKRLRRKVPTFKEDLASLRDKNFHVTLLSFPMLGVILFTILPLIFMISIAFTNYDRNHQVPGNLFTWVGLENFRTIVAGSSVLRTSFWGILGWTIIWAIFATFSNFFLGMILAMIINKRGIRFKTFYRTIFILSIAIPQFVSLLIMRNMLSINGPINVLLSNIGIGPIPFLDNVTWARVSVIIVNLWIGIPYTMLITTGILLNIPRELYEAALVDGANSIQMFRRITLPYVFFVTSPYLITQFIGNINNFNVIYLLTTGNPATLSYYQAGKTDLLVTWLYKLTVNSKDYSYAATIGIIIFIIMVVISLSTYRRTGAYRNEEGFQA